MTHNKHGNPADLGLLALRVTFGGLMAGHGAQKLFGHFGGPGLEGMSGFMGALGMKPPKVWAMMAGGSEFGSGVLTALGLLSPLGPVSMFGPMLTAWDKAHRGKPVWVTSGGPEVPILYLAASTALAAVGPGRYSLDELLGVEIPDWFVSFFAAGVVAGFAAAMMQEPPSPTQELEHPSGDSAHELPPAPDAPESNA